MCIRDRGYVARDVPHLPVINAFAEQARKGGYRAAAVALEDDRKQAVSYTHLVVYKSPPPQAHAFVIPADLADLELWPLVNGSRESSDPVQAEVLALLRDLRVK